MNDKAQTIADRLGQIDGVVAVVLGGSRARGTASPDSDIDLGIYYQPDQPPRWQRCAHWRRNSTTATATIW